MKNPSFLRVLAAMLCLLMLASTVIACAKDTPGSTDTTAAADTTASDTTESPYDEKGYLKDSLPKDLTFAKNGQSEPVTILGWEYRIPEFDVEELSGDVVESAIYERNMAVEERLGIDLQFALLPGDATYFRDWCKTIMNSVNANAQAYDAVAGYLRSAGVLTANHMLLDMLELDYLDFEKPWWSDSLLEMNTIHDQLYFISGDIATSLLYQMMILVYNTELGNDLGLENPQQTAIDGNWTWDKFAAMTKDVYSDLDNDGKKSRTDRYGLFSVVLSNIDIFYMGAGIHFLEADEDGYIGVSDSYFSERALTVLDRMIELWHVSNDGRLDTSAGIGDNQYVSLFYNATCLQLAETVRYSDMEYCVLPGPKFDESQENYYTCTTLGHTMYMIPLDAHDADMTAAVLECLCSESYRRTTPAVFETAFKYQYAQNQLDTQIFDILRSNVVYDLGRVFSEEYGTATNPNTIMRTFVRDGQNTLATVRPVYERMWQKSSEKLNNLFLDN